MTDMTLELRQRLETDFCCVNRATNPVATQLETLQPSQLLHIILQYTIFSKKIVSFLCDGFYSTSYAGLDHIADELLTNMHEELGREGNSSAVAHYTLLRRGILTSLKVDLSAVRPSQATKEFVDAIHSLMSLPDGASAAGCAYALEATARPELVMTYEWVSVLYSAHGQTPPEDVRTFFTAHIDEIEVLHEDRLRRACLEDIEGDQARTAFRTGFLDTLRTMDDWWQGLSREATAPSARTE